MARTIHIKPNVKASTGSYAPGGYRGMAGPPMVAAPPHVMKHKVAGNAVGMPSKHERKVRARKVGVSMLRGRARPNVAR